MWSERKAIRLMVNNLERNIAKSLTLYLGSKLNTQKHTEVALWNLSCDNVYLLFV